MKYNFDDKEFANSLLRNILMGANGKENFVSLVRCRREDFV